MLPQAHTLSEAQWKWELLNYASIRIGDREGFKVAQPSLSITNRGRGFHRFSGKRGFRIQSKGSKSIMIVPDLI